MRELFSFIVGFFNSSRRKMAFVTLLFACGFMVGWVRSDVIKEEISVSFAPKGGGRYEVTSMGRSLNFVRTTSFDDQPAIWAWPKLSWNSSETARSFETDIMSKEFKPSGSVNGREWRFEVGRFHCGSVACAVDDSLRKQFVIIPHWSVIVILVLISASLLSSKPRKKPDS